MKRSLTNRFCETVKTKIGRIEISDSHDKSWNLVLRVTSRGTKTWCVQYRLGGKRQRIKLGEFPSTSLEKARTKSLGVGALIEDGINPFKHEQQAKLDALTVSEAVQEYIIHSRDRAKLKTRKQKQCIFEKWVLPIEGEVVTRQCAVITPALVPDRDVRLDPLLPEPAELLGEYWMPSASV